MWPLDRTQGKKLIPARRMTHDGRRTTDAALSQ